MFNWDRYRELIRGGVRFLDSVVDFNSTLERQALEEQVEISKNSRRIGLGLTGLGDAFFKLGISYGSKASKRMLQEIMSVYAVTAYKESIEIAKELGPFPAFEYEKFTQSGFMKRLMKEIEDSGDKQFDKDLKKYGIRNVTVLTIAPVGSGSEILGGVSSGIEPIFAAAYKRTVQFSEGYREFTEYIPVVKEYMKLTGKSQLPEYFITAHDLSPDTRIDIQSMMQKYVDTSISSTINLASNASIDDVSKIYISAWKAGLKGITVYREGSREGILHTLNGHNGDRGLLKKLFKSSRDIIQPRPFSSPGVRYVISYEPNKKATIGIYGDVAAGIPEELLIWVKNVEDEPLARTISMMINMQLRRDAALGISSEWLLEELNSVTSATGAFHKDEYSEHGIHIKGLAHAARHALSLFLEKKYPKLSNSTLKESGHIDNSSYIGTDPSTPESLGMCEKCHAAAVVYENGCRYCKNCGHSKCG